MSFNLLFPPFQLRLPDMDESATNEDRDDLCVLHELIYDESDDSSRDEWSSDSGDEFVPDEEITNRDR